MDVGRIDVSTDHGESYTCAEKESAVTLPMFIVRLLLITPTQSETRCFLIETLLHLYAHLSYGSALANSSCAFQNVHGSQRFSFCCKHLWNCR